LPGFETRGVNLGGSSTFEASVRGFSNAQTAASVKDASVFVHLDRREDTT